MGDRRLTDTLWTALQTVAALLGVKQSDAAKVYRTLMREGVLPKSRGRHVEKATPESVAQLLLAVAASKAIMTWNDRYMARVAAAEIASEVAQIIADRKIAERLECIDICPMLGSAEIEFYRRDKEWWPFPHVDEPGRSDMSDEMVLSANIPGGVLVRIIDRLNLVQPAAPSVAVAISQRSIESVQAPLLPVC